MDITKQVSVVIPTYNRAHIIAKTIPTYLQPAVGEIIVVDDCSTDGTPDVLRRLKEKIPEIRIFRNDANRKQTYSKNRGVLAAKYPYVYFGDDDSFITEGTVETLLKYAQEHSNGLIAARPLYAGNMSQVKYVERFISSTEKFSADEGYTFFDLNSMLANTRVYYTKLTKVNVVHACFLVCTEIAKHLKFDEKYNAGNAFREETDYIIQALRKGCQCYFAPNAYQINYPRETVSRNDMRVGLKREWGCLKNTIYFLDKHYRFLKENNMVTSAKWVIVFHYLCGVIKKYINWSTKGNKTV